MVTSEMIAAVRADSVVGRGTCSVIDECYTDEELREDLTESGCLTVKAAVRWARSVESLFREREHEVRAEIF